MKDKRAQKFMWTLGYSSSFAVSCEGLSGGLALFWLQPYNVTLKGFNAHCIDVIISADAGIPWCATFVYGEPRRDKRHEFWTLLRRLCNHWEGPWIVCGDFNEALYKDEHSGPRERPDTQMDMFKDCLDVCGLVDLAFLVQSSLGLIGKIVTVMCAFALIKRWLMDLSLRFLIIVLSRIPLPPPRIILPF